MCYMKRQAQCAKEAIHVVTRSHNPVVAYQPTDSKYYGLAINIITGINIKNVNRTHYKCTCMHDTMVQLMS